jgi:transposase
MKVTLIGIDLAKNVFQICGVNQAGNQVFNKAVKRNKLLSQLLKYPDAIIAMEAWWFKLLGKRITSTGL